LRQIGFILGTLLLVSAIVGWVFLTEEPEGSVGMEHPSIPGMQIGGEGSARIEPVSVLAFALHAGTLVLVCGFAFWAWLSIILTVCIVVWWFVFWGYQAFLKSGETLVVFGFPVPSAWAIYGVWGSGVLLTVLYVIGFRRFVFSSEDEEAFDDFVARIERERGSD
jgi:hypothetical protein